MAKLPFILVTPSVEKRGVEFNDLSLSVSYKYEQAVLRAGGIPVIAPLTTDRKVLAEVVRRSDGVLLTGGDDINPDIYEPKISRALRKTVGETPDGGIRDVMELTLLDEIFRQRKPLLAICRGHQILNIALGGQLIIDIAQQIPGCLNHRRMDKALEFVHHVPVAKGSQLARITKAKTLGMNTTHHQAVVEPAAPLRAVATTSDGVVEAMELKPEAADLLPFLISVQFHPERLADRHPEHRAIFTAFVKACRT